MSSLAEKIYFICLRKEFKRLEYIIHIMENDEVPKVDHCAFLHIAQGLEKQSS